MKTSPPVYSHVAYDIAMKIASGELREQDRFSGRSLMSSQYGVSPETIRRALRLLFDMGIVAIHQGVGVAVVSRQRAAEYVEQYKAGRDLHTLKQELRALMERRAALDDEIETVITRIHDLSDRFRHSDWLRTYEFTLSRDSLITDRSIEETRFRQSTGGTIIAIRRGDALMLSPSPDTVLRAGDTLIIACDMSGVELVSDFIARRRAQ